MDSFRSNDVDMCLEKIVEGAEGFEWIWAFDATSVEYGAREEKWLHISSIAPICSHLSVHKEKVNKMKKKKTEKGKKHISFIGPICSQLQIIYKWGIYALGWLMVMKMKIVSWGKAHIFSQ